MSTLPSRSLRITAAFAALGGVACHALLACIGEPVGTRPGPAEAGAGPADLLDAANDGFSVDDDAGDAADAAVNVFVLPLAAGGDRVCAFRPGGRIKCWGDNQFGALGVGSDVPSLGGDASDMGEDLPFVDLGRDASVTWTGVGYRHVCAALDSGNLKCWGLGVALGTESTISRGADAAGMGDELPPALLGTTRKVKRVSSGLDFSCALLDDGSVKCWGFNNGGQLGLGDTVNRSGPDSGLGDALHAVELGTGRTVVAISTGALHTCAVLDDGKVKCWGFNTRGQLGLGDTTNRGRAAAEMGDALPAVDLGAGRTAIGIGCGGEHSCALLDDHTIKCWGYGSYGQLGQGSNATLGTQSGQMGDALPSVSLGAGRTARAIAAGRDHTCAILDDARVKCWGRNSSGQLGVGDDVHRGTDPSQMGDDLPSVNLGPGRTAKAIVGGQSFTCALLDDDSIKCWGDNARGQLGLGDKRTRGVDASDMGVNLPAVDLGP